MANSGATAEISDWKSIVTLILFVVTNVIVLFPFHIPVYVPRVVSNAVLDLLGALRVIAKRKVGTQHDGGSNGESKPDDAGYFVRLRFPMNFVTAPLISDLFLLAIRAIGRQEVHDGTIGANNISPIDVMVFFITLAYIAISIDASGLIRWLAFRVLKWGGSVGHRLFFYLYAFFFALGTFIGNDPIILSGTAFLAYMTRVSKNIDHPKAWIYSQFAVANIASAILVSSNPTNLVLAGAFEIKFIHYTANMIVPVVITAVVLFPFLLYIVFANESLIPASIEMETLSEEEQNKIPINPNIPYARGPVDEQDENASDGDQRKLLPLEEIMNPFLDKGGAAFGAVIMAATLITVLALNAASTSSGEHPVFWVTLPAAFVMFCWDIGFGWYRRAETREIAGKGREEARRRRAEKARLEEEKKREKSTPLTSSPDTQSTIPMNGTSVDDNVPLTNPAGDGSHPPLQKPSFALIAAGSDVCHAIDIGESGQAIEISEKKKADVSTAKFARDDMLETRLSEKAPRRNQDVEDPTFSEVAPTTLVSLAENGYIWLQDTFPTAAAVIAHLPFALVPFAFAMFVLVQALVTKGWVQIFAKGWDHWVHRTGTLGSIAGMGFLSAVLCNFAGTNIGTTILLSRVIQEWEALHQQNGTTISDRTFWGTVYSMALGVNYGAFSTAFSASLAGLLWRDILARKHIKVKSVEFARVNFPIIAISMTVGCTALVAEIYIIRDNSPYNG